ncbi:MAG: YlbE-like family protein [Bacilli bacterium]|nr:YlbE-like family protein [Bacilli bacterium]
MQVNVKIAIEQNPNLKRYLKENSYWYHYLNRDPSYLEMMDEEMKKKYKLTTEDRIEKMYNSISMMSEFLKILK